MIHKLVACLALLFLTAAYANEDPIVRHAITYEGGARFGDRVLCYAQARYLSYATGIPFLYCPFPFSECLNIQYQAKPDNRYIRHRYRCVFRINSPKTLAEFFCKIRNPKTPPTLFILEYATADLGEWEVNSKNSLAFNIPWDDPGFNAYLKESLRPNIPIPDFTQPNMLNVAVHVRTMSGDDTPESVLGTFPLKFPPLEYHKNQVMRVYEWNMHRPMHVFIFSDSKEPHQLVEEFRRTFSGKLIEFNIQTVDRPDLNTVVQDFFAMQKFNVLITTQSNFSLMAARIASVDMTISPIHATGRYPQPYHVDRVQVVSKQTPWFPFALNTILKDDK